MVIKSSLPDIRPFGDIAGGREIKPFSAKTAPAAP